MQADFGAAIPASSFLSLDGGVLETLAGGTFTRELRRRRQQLVPDDRQRRRLFHRRRPLRGQHRRQAAPTTLAWGNGVGSQLVGTLKLCSPTCTNSVTFLNPIDLSGGARTIQVDGNPNSTADYAVLPAAISDSVGGGSLAEDRRRARSTCKAPTSNTLLRPDDDHGHAGGGEDAAAPSPFPATSTLSETRRRHQHASCNSAATTRSPPPRR